MKHWIMKTSVTAAILLSLSGTCAWAGDGLQREHSTTPAGHGTLRPVADAPGYPGVGRSGLHQIELHSSVQVSKDALRDAYVASREAYTKKLQKYAKCSESEAKKAVTAAHPGMKVENLQLRNIRTNLVYVSIIGDDEDKYLVIVDAGNGKVLMDKELPTHHERAFASHSE